MSINLKRKSIITMIFAIIIFANFVLLPSYNKHNISFAATDAKKIVLGTSADYPPYAYHKQIGKDDQIAGFDISIAYAIASDLGAELEIKDMRFDGLLAALESGNVDMVIACMDPTEERKKHVDFSDPYYKAGTAVMVMSKDALKYNSLKDFEGSTIGVQKNTTKAQLVAHQMKNVEIKELGKFADLILQLRTGKIDAIVGDEAVAKSYESVNNDMVITDIKLSENEGDKAVALRKGDTELLNSINKTIARITQDGEINKYFDEAVNGVYTDGTEVSFIKKYYMLYIVGAKNTVLLSLFATIIGTAIGICVALLRLSRHKILRFISASYVEFIRGTPVLVQLFIIYFGLQALGIKFPQIPVLQGILGLNPSDFIAGVITLGINSGAYVGEIFRAGIQAVPKGQTEAARSLGFTQLMSLKYVVLPQAIKNVLPALGNEFVVIIKESSIVSIIGIADLMYSADTVRGITFQPFEPLVIAAIFYFMMTFPLSKLIGAIERRMGHAN